MTEATGGVPAAPGSRAVGHEGVAEADLFRATFDRSPIGAALFELDGTVVEVNEALRDILGRRDPPAKFLSDTVFAEDLADAVESFRSLVAGEVDHVVREQRLRRADGEAAWVRVTAGPIPRPDGRPALILAHIVDITLEHEVAAELRRRAEHDPLTGLVTREVVLAALTSAVDAARDDRHLLAVLYVDLDRFKQINDRLGHDAGDRVLVHVAEEIVAAIRPGDVASRIGGDEFVVVLQGIRSEDEAKVVAERIRASLASPVFIDGRAGATVGASIGVALSHGFTTAEALLRDADAALYRAKERGRDRVEVFDAALRARAVQRLSTELLLRQSLDEGAMALQFEPAVDLGTGRVVGADALIGLRGADDELLPVAEVLSVAEESGLGHVLGAGALDLACQALARWAASNPTAWVSLVTTSAQLAHPGYTDRLERSLLAHAADPTRLRIEVPGAVPMAGAPHLIAAIDRVRGLGVGVVLDGGDVDLGSLAAIDGLPIDAVKLDLRTLPDVVANPIVSSLISCVPGVSGAAGIEALVAGVDRPEQLEVVVKLGYRLVQGAAVRAVIDVDSLVATNRGN